MKFGLVFAKENKEAQGIAVKIRDYLKIKGHKIFEGDLKGAEVVLVLGGDGTLIHVACEHIELGVPFFGINTGTLGFLTAVEGKDWQEAIERIIKGDYFVSERMTLEASIEANSKSQTLNSKFRALNDVVVKGVYRVVDLEIRVNGHDFMTTRGDGVILATQTGSTAYSLSAGGPIIDPNVDCLLVTPINAHGLPIPSVALSPNDAVEIKITAGDDISLIIDGQEHTKISQSQSVKVQRGKYRVKLGYFDKQHFLKALNAKFGLASRLVS